MIVALYMPDKRIKVYNSHEIPMAFMMTIAERVETAKQLDVIRDRKLQNVVIQTAVDITHRMEMTNRLFREQEITRMREALQKDKFFKTYLAQTYGDIPGQVNDSIIGGG
jgi:hypothetical protein